MRKATQDESCDVRVALMSYFDEVEERAPQRPRPRRAGAPAPPTARPFCAQTCDALAYAKGKHKLGGYQFATLNLPVEERFDHGNIVLAGLAKNLTIKKGEGTQGGSERGRKTRSSNAAMLQGVYRM